MANWLSCIGSHLVLYKIDLFFFCLVCKHENILGLEFVLTLVLEIIGWFARMFSFFFVLSFFFISIVCKDDGVLATFLKLA